MAVPGRFTMLMTQTRYEFQAFHEAFNYIWLHLQNALIYTYYFSRRRLKIPFAVFVKNVRRDAHCCDVKPWFADCIDFPTQRENE